MEEQETKTKKTRLKAPKGVKMSSKTAKYFKYHNLDGLTKTEAVKKAGLSSVENTTNIERNKTYQILKRTYAEILEEHMPKDMVAFELSKNALQDQDKGAKNNALKMIMERVEPAAQQKAEDDRLIIVLR